MTGKMENPARLQNIFIQNAGFANVMSLVLMLTVSIMLVNITRT